MFAQVLLQSFNELLYTIELPIEQSYTNDEGNVMGKSDSHRKVVNHLKNCDPILKSIVEKSIPHILESRSRYPFDVLASSIISQQLSTNAAGTIKKRLLEFLDISRPLLPKHFVHRNVDELRSCGLSNAKSSYIISLANNIYNKKLLVNKLDDMTDEEVIQHLISQPGIGRWTAEMFLIFGLGREDVFSLTDAGLRRAVKEIYKIRKELTDKQLLRISNKWSPYRSIASLYLWGYIDSV